jgi:acetoin utilization deacetylase AcuC-like enzyme
MAALAAGGAVLTANIAIKGEPAFGLIRPPGHHASRSSYWGFCYFNNMAIALLYLQARGLIRSAFILDFDLHFGDGTVDILGGDSNFHIHNPQGHGDDNYISDVKLALDNSPDVDIIAASAGFDEYEHCWGHNLSTDAFRRIGHLMSDFARERCKGRRFGLLEGGYNHEDLGKNILAFCEGLQGR